GADEPNRRGRLPSDECTDDGKDQQGPLLGRASVPWRPGDREGVLQGVSVVRHEDEGHGHIPRAELHGLRQVQRHDPGEVHAHRAIASCRVFAGLFASTSSRSSERRSRASPRAPRSEAISGRPTAFLLVAGSSAQVAREPWAIGIAAIAKYLVHSALVDLVVALQVRRNPIGGWWTLHRRLMPYEVALLVLGALAAIAAQAQPWTLVLFGVPMAIVLLTVRDSANVREQTKSAILELADLIDLRDPYTHGHSQRVAALAERLARRMRLEYAQVELIRDAARVHDIGKIGTNDMVLLKPGPLTEEEQREMRRHAEIGPRLLRRLTEFCEGAELVRSPYERPAGSGYPH